MQAQFETSRLLKPIWYGEPEKLVQLVREMLPYLENPRWAECSKDWTEFSPTPTAPNHWLAASLVPGCGRALVAVTYVKLTPGRGGAIRHNDGSREPICGIFREYGLGEAKTIPGRKFKIPIFFAGEMVLVCLDRNGLSEYWKRKLEKGEVLDGTDL